MSSSASESSIVYHRRKYVPDHEVLHNSTSHLQSSAHVFASSMMFASEMKTSYAAATNCASALIHDQSILTDMFSCLPLRIQLIHRPKFSRPDVDSVGVCICTADPATHSTPFELINVPVSRTWTKWMNVSAWALLGVSANI